MRHEYSFAELLPSLVPTWIVSSILEHQVTLRLGNFSTA